MADQDPYKVLEECLAGARSEIETRIDNNEVIERPFHALERSFDIRCNQEKLDLPPDARTAALQSLWQGLDPLHPVSEKSIRVFERERRGCGR